VRPPLPRVPKRRRPLLISTTFDLSSFMPERSGRWAPSTRQVARRAFRSFFAFALWLDDHNHQKPGHDWLRTTDSGDRLGPDGVRMVIRRVSDRSGVKFSSHDARRSGSVAIVLKMSSNRSNKQVSRCSSMSVGGRAQSRDHAASHSRGPSTSRRKSY
jgi:hypothetical protein